MKKLILGIILSFMAVSAYGDGLTCLGGCSSSSGGGVSSVGMTGDGVVFAGTVPGSPVTSAGTLSPSLASHAAGLVLASPSGSSGTPTFRALVSSDLPAPFTLTTTGSSGAATFSAGTLNIPQYSAAAVSITSLSPNLVVTPSPLTGIGTIADNIIYNNQSTTTPYTIQSTDGGKVVTHNSSSAIAETLPAPTTSGFGSTFAYIDANYGTGTKTITCSGCTINGQSTYTESQFQQAQFTNDGGTHWYAFGSGNSSGISASANNTFTAAQRFAPVTVAISTSTYTPNFDAGNNFNITLVHAACPCTVANPSTTLVPGQTGRLLITQSSTGTDTIGTWGSSYVFSGGTAPTLSTGASVTDIFTYYIDISGKIIVGNAIANIAGLSANNGFSGLETITIDHTKVGTVNNTDQTNFPVLISGTYTYLKTTGNGGSIQNTATLNSQTVPTDLVFTTDNSCSSNLTWEVSSYNASTGNIEAWVKIPTLSHTTNTTIYMCYGKSSVTTYQATASSTWDSNYALVMHLANGTTLSALDSTVNAFNGTITGVQATSGQIDGAGLWGTLSTDKINTGLSTTNSLRTYDSWIYITGSGGGTLGRIVDNNQGTNNEFISVDGGVNIDYQKVFSGASALFQSAMPTLNAWHHLVISYDSTNTTNLPIVYVDGVSQSVTTAVAPSGAATSAASVYTLGNRGDNARNFAGNMDEFRVSNSIRSADWVKTEYNNQSSPSTFYTIAP